MHNMKRPAQAPFGPPAIAHELLLVWPARHQRLPSSRHPGRPGPIWRLWDDYSTHKAADFGDGSVYSVYDWVFCRFFHGLPQFIGFPSQKIREFPLISWGSFNVRELPVAWSWVPQRRSAACKGRPWRPAARGVPKSLRVRELSRIPHHSHRPSQTYPLVN